MNVNLDRDFERARVVSSPPMIKGYGAVYRIEVRVLFHPESGRTQCAVEVTDDATRELFEWRLFPGTTGVDATVAQLQEVIKLVEAHYESYSEPF